MATMPDERHNDLAKRYRDLAVLCASVMPQRLELHPHPDDVTAYKAQLTEFAAHVDGILEATADYIAHYTGYDIEPPCKAQVLFDAIEGNLLYEIEQAALEAGTRRREGV